LTLSVVFANARPLLKMFAAYRRLQSASDADRDGLMDGRDLLEAMCAAGAPRIPDRSSLFVQSF
jgi:hypothetical protein